MNGKKQLVRRVAGVFSAVAVVGSLLLAAPAVAASERGATPSSDEWNGNEFALRPRLDLGRALDAQGTVNTEQANEGPRQVFVPQLQADGWYTLRNPQRNANLAAGNVSSPPTFSTAVSGATEWRFVVQGNGTFEVQNRETSRKLHFAPRDNNRVTMAAASVTDDNTQWFISPIGGALANGANYGISLHSNNARTLDVEGAPSVVPGASAQLNFWAGNPSQWWRVEYDTRYGMYRLRNLNNQNVVLERRGDSSQVIVGSPRGIWEQLWLVRQNEDGSWGLLNLSFGRFDALQGDANNSVLVMPYNDNIGAQEWSLLGPRR